MKSALKFIVVVFVVGMISLAYGCQSEPPSQEVDVLADTEAQNRALARRLFEELDNGNPAIFTELSHPDAKFHLPGSPGPIGPSDLAGFVASFYEAFPDYTHVIEDVIAEGDKVVVRCVDRGTHKGEYMGIPATGSSFEYGEIVILQIADGKVVEAWVQEDTLWMMQQLGMDLKPKELGT